MIIECEIKTGQTVESIEHIRREGGDGVVSKIEKRSRKMMEWSQKQ